MNFVIIGGDAAGMSAASRAKRRNPDMEVIVLEQTKDVSYSACGMPYNIADPERDIDDLIVRQPKVFREKQGIDLRTGHRVEAIDPEKGTVKGRTLDGGPFQVEFDELLIATGASALIPDLPGFDLPGVMSLKSLEDGRRIKRFIKEHRVKQAVIIGMGYIALEMSEALRTRGIEVVLIKPNPLFLPWMHEKLSRAVREEMEAKGVQLYPGHEVKGIEQGDSRLRVICADRALEAQMVLVAIGVQPNSGVAQDAGIALSIANSVAVDRGLLTSKSHIYAAGDCADAYHVVTGEKTWIPLALRANRAGWAVADTVTGKAVTLPGVAGTAVFKVFDLEVAHTGLTVEEAAEHGFEPVEMTIQGRTRAHAHPGGSSIGVHMVGDRKSGRLLGVQMVGREGAAHRIDAPAVALHGKMTVEEFVQCDLAYAPPFSPVWDPMLTAANQLLKSL
jgi:CoA-dependent NAD(P)H sulfur oxidoreductase